jgi:hypothetical protein
MFVVVVATTRPAPAERNVSGPCASGARIQFFVPCCAGKTTPEHTECTEKTRKLIINNENDFFYTFYRGPAALSRMLAKHT